MERVRVTVEDPATGESERAEVPPDSYVVICGEHMEIAGEQWYANGTRIITLKRRAPAVDGPPDMGGADG